MSYADWRGRLLTRAIVKPRQPVHQAAYYQALTLALGITAGPLQASVRTNHARSRELLHEIGLDPDEPFVVFAPGVVYAVPGSNPLSGTYRGPDEVMGYFGRLMETTAGT